MEAEYDSFEIVRVIHGYKLIDSESYERRYARRSGIPLVPGYYVVTWDDGIVVKRFDYDAAFFGPFRLRQEAQAALARFQSEGASASSTAWSGRAPHDDGMPPASDIPATHTHVVTADYAEPVTW